MDVETEIAGWKGVPIRFEIGLSPGATLEGDSFALEARTGGTMQVTSGVLRVRQGLDVMAVGPFFAEHHETVGAYDGEGRDRDRFTVYATAFTPVKKSLAFTRAPRTDEADRAR